MATLASALGKAGWAAAAAGPQGSSGTETDFQQRFVQPASHCAFPGTAAYYPTTVRGGLRKAHTCHVAEAERPQVTEPEGLEVAPPGCSRIKVTLGRPLGLILEDDKDGNIYVAEVQSGGNAERSGLVDVGDQLIATSAVVYSSSEDYLGVAVRKGQQEVRLNVRGERFDTVMAAIGSHPAHMKVTLEFQKCQPGSGPKQKD